MNDIHTVLFSYNGKSGNGKIFSLRKSLNKHTHTLNLISWNTCSSVNNRTTHVVLWKSMNENSTIRMRMCGFVSWNELENQERTLSRGELERIFSDGRIGLNSYFAFYKYERIYVKRELNPQEFFIILWNVVVEKVLFIILILKQLASVFFNCKRIFSDSMDFFVRLVQP